MNQKLRDGTVIIQKNGQDRFLGLLYGHSFGRAVLKPLVSPTFSRLAGRFLSSRASRVFIRPFIRQNHIDMSQFEEKNYVSYNEFFSRRIRPGARTVDMEPMHLVSPCDSKLTVLPVTEDGVFTLKHTPYTVASLLQNERLAADYLGGQALIFRLTVDDYHRYCYVCGGEKTENIFIPGKLHTVNPIANGYFPIYKENSREYSILRTKEFDDILMMEVGALMVGKIVNHHEKTAVHRGEEKGYFQFGGSTVVLLFKKDTVRIDSDILENSCQGFETVVKYGERIGASLRSH